MLAAGEGDFVAAFLTATPERIEDGVSFSRAYHFATEFVVGRSTENPMTSPADLAGRTIVVRRSSSYWTHLEELRQRDGIGFELVEARANMETEAILAAVADGTYDLTVADSHLLELEMTLRDDLKGLLQVSEPMPHSWAVHPANTGLMSEINAFFASHYRGLFFNVVYEKYFERPEQFGTGWDDAGAADRLSPYDDIVRELAEYHGYDWRLTTAQMYQESRFDPRARSWAGALGLMQVLPRTARELGITELEDPRTGIEAGLRYMVWVWDRFPDHLESAEHMWFTLAGYNAGHGHVRDARRLARQLDLDADLWFSNVELAMLKLSQAQYARQARHGFVRGREPVGYVRGIRERYRAYVDLLGSDITNPGRN
jgi:membrane-bound lytic murein transglycosylase F